MLGVDAAHFQLTLAVIPETGPNLNGDMANLTQEEIDKCIEETQTAKGDGKGKGTHRHEEYTNEKPDDALDIDGNRIPAAGPDILSR